jgi:hypothetical protein
MIITAKHIHVFLLSLIFTWVTWNIVDMFIINVGFFKWIIIEFILVIMQKFYKFTSTKVIR